MFRNPRHLIIASLITLVTALVLPTSAGAAFTWDGTWETGEWGTLTARGDVNGFEGTYTHDEGHLRMTLADAATRTYTGWWDEAPSRSAPNDAGEATFTVAADGRSFSGQWRYGTDGTWRSWYGTCTAGACLSNGAAVDEPADWPLPDAIVPIARVINGCGGGSAGTDPRWGDTSTYREGTRRWLVNFRPACNLHDVGYSGAKVLDPLRGNAVLDTFSWSQRRIDDRFLADMVRICRTAIPAAAAKARHQCTSNAGFRLSARSRYDLVRAFGHRWYVPRPKLSGTWKLANGTRWSLTQRGRVVSGTWTRDGRSGTIKATVISYDQSSLLRGFEKVRSTDSWDIGSAAITWSPKRANELRISSVSFTGNAVRLSVR